MKNIHSKSISNAGESSFAEKFFSFSLFTAVIAAFSYAFVVTASATLPPGTIPLPSHQNDFGANTIKVKTPFSEEDLMVATLETLPASEYMNLWEKAAHLSPEQNKVMLGALVKICQRAMINPCAAPFGKDGKTVGGLAPSAFNCLYERCTPNFLGVVGARLDNSPSLVTKSELEALVRARLSRNEIRVLECYLTNPFLGFSDKTIDAQVKLAALAVLVRANPVFCATCKSEKQMSIF